MPQNSYICFMRVINNLLESIPFKPSPNIGKVITPEYIIIHYTASSNAAGAIEWMLSPKSKVSAHLHEDRDGNFVQLVPFNVAAWHAGVSEWKGLVGLNSHSIGIELQNTGTQEYTQIQLDNLVEACKAICHAFKIKEILGHSDIAPGRKTDPGKQFPMKWLREQVLPQSVSASVIVTKHTKSDLNLRDGAGTSFKALSVLTKNTEVNILAEDDGWAQVFVCGSKSIGWVNKAYLV